MRSGCAQHLHDGTHRNGGTGGGVASTTFLTLRSKLVGIFTKSCLLSNEFKIEQSERGNYLILIFMLYSALFPLGFVGSFLHFSVRLCYLTLYTLIYFVRVKISPFTFRPSQLCELCAGLAEV